MSINCVTISGNLTRDCELRTAPSGMAIAKFTVAVNERRKDGNEWTDVANYVPCTLFCKLGEKLAPQLTKGSKVCVQGSLRYSSWEKDGDTRSKLEVIVKEIEVLPKFRDEPYHEEAYSEDLPF